MFHTIDLKKWPRAQMYYYFSKMAPTGYSITAELDVTYLYDAVKKAGVKFFPAYLWLVTRRLNEQIEFKCAVKEGVLGYYDTLTPLYAAMHDDDHTISFMWTEFSDDFNEFYKKYLENQHMYGDNHGVLAQPMTPPPENAYTVSAVPWIHFKHFAVHSYDNKEYYFPSVEAGKFETRGDKKIMPISITCHHAVADGYHVSKFLEELQEDMNNFICSE
ncbi:MAG: CatA-like O-acetyltransferase [Anaerovoracaceae bacterium]